MSIIRMLLLVVFSALLCSTVFAPVSWWFLASVSWLPLISILDKVRPVVAWRLGVLHGVVFYGISLSWLRNIFAPYEWVVVFLVLLLALFTGVFAGGAAYLSSTYRSGFGRILLIASWWVAVEFIRCELYFLKFPWMTPGVGLGPNFISPIIGVYGISFCVIAACLCLSSKGRVRGLGVVAAAVLIWSSQPRSAEKVEGESVKILAIQAEGVSGSSYIEMAQRNHNAHDFIIFPEYSYLSDVRKDSKEWMSLRGLAESTDSILVVGTRTDTVDGGHYNTALSLDQHGVLGEHYKNHPVHFFNDGIAGRQATAIRTKHGKIGTPICFDNDYEDVVRRMVRDGANFLLVPSMDARHWSDRQHWQHAELFRHRAAENARWMAVASSSGVTQVIDDRGRRVDSLKTMIMGTLSAQLEANAALSFYTRWGWLFSWFSLVISSVVVLYHLGKGAYSWVSTRINKG